MVIITIVFVLLLRRNNKEPALAHSAARRGKGHSLVSHAWLLSHEQSVTTKRCVVSSGSPKQKPRKSFWTTASRPRSVSFVLKMSRAPPLSCVLPSRGATTAV